MRFSSKALVRVEAPPPPPPTQSPGIISCFVESFAIFVARSSDRVPTSDGMVEATLEIWSRDLVVSSADRDRSPLHKISLRGIDGFSVVPGLRDTKEILIRFRTYDERNLRRKKKSSARNSVS